MRKLSDYQRKPWMDRISKLRKYKNQAKGEDHGKAKINEVTVNWIRKASLSDRLMTCRLFSISERHWYHIRAGKRWSHL